MLFSTHKNFPGPQKAAIVTRECNEIWERVQAGLSLLVSSSHAESSYLMGLTLLEEDLLTAYADRLTATAVALERELGAHGVPVLPRSVQGDAGWPATHHVWIRCETRDAAFASFQLLTAVNLHVNYRKLPYGLGWGLRLGTTHAVMSGLTTACVGELADIIAAAMAGAAAPDLRPRVEALARSMAADAIGSARLAA